MARGHDHDYEIEATIGEGGMGVVRRARHKFLRRLVAIKEIKAEAMHDEEFRERFDREARAAASLLHENIVCIFDYWRTDTSMAIVMEYVDGISLQQLLLRLRTLGPPLAAFVAREMARGLGHVHHHGLVHRDVKSSNVLISREGDVKIGDFGVVKVEGAVTDLTVAGSAVGTPNYMSPEQLEGEHKKVDARSDVFSLGVCLYEMLAGIRPFGMGDAAATAIRVSHGKSIPLTQAAPHVPRALKRIVHRCIHHKPKRRFKSMVELERALDRALWRYDLEAAPKALGSLLSAAKAPIEETRARGAKTKPPEYATTLPPHPILRRIRLFAWTFVALAVASTAAWFLVPLFTAGEAPPAAVATEAPPAPTASPATATPLPLAVPSETPISPTVVLLAPTAAPTVVPTKPPAPTATNRPAPAAPAPAKVARAASPAVPMKTRAASPAHVTGPTRHPAVQSKTPTRPPQRAPTRRAGRG